MKIIYLLNGNFSDIEQWKDVTLYELDQMLAALEWVKKQERKALEESSRSYRK
ncbi:MAG: hypothetical protein F6J98_01610 [Moorea sp. SIO4G2]|nr:hypothetical protein [Moorena sp. SIO4G2]